MVWIGPRTKGSCILLTNGLLAKVLRQLVQVSNVVAGAFV